VCGEFYPSVILLTDLSQATLSTHKLASYAFKLGGDLESINNKHLRKTYLPKIEARNLCSQNGTIPEACGLSL
jgi:hypothetical protein